MNHPTKESGFSQVALPGKSGDEKKSLSLVKYTMALAIAWTVIMVASLLWITQEVKQDMLEFARIKARVAHEKDVSLSQNYKQHTLMSQSRFMSGHQT
ncbi:MAG: hypothetical protein U1C46_03925 [Bacteroidales bacterium]|nr:hypothetical protein [Bacteroidales bacterium]MDZ4203950.1 hypothetical protein [Bacteroidales bacterium]